MTTQSLLLRLLRAQSQMSKRLDRALSLHGLSLSEFQVLDALSTAPDQSLRRIDLADAVGLTASGVTRLLNPMEKIGLVDKQASARDARVSLVRLSSAGATRLEEARSRVREVADGLFAPLGEPMRRELDALIGQLEPYA
ncbi:MAG: MarR family transcriptional regulator [Abyssibacter sp.]|uniref:MarR family winged helix-turn-helix transcriptional regulator n=1 Tax=Abyssibacter sp. TaxID=2320200 RepID=UPI00321BF3E9